MKKTIVVEIMIFVLALLFIYTGVSKLWGFEGFKKAMYNQDFSHGFASLLIVVLPSLEVLTAICLFFRKTRTAGLYIYLFLMSLFTGYIALVLLNAFHRLPCSCGGVIKALGWKGHLIFNLFFLILALVTILLQKKTRPESKTEMNTAM